MTDDEYAAWMAQQNAHSLPPAIDVQSLQEQAITFFDQGILNDWMRINNLDDQPIDPDEIATLIREWIDMIDERPFVLSVRAFNNWAHTKRGKLYLLGDMLEAWETVLLERFPHRFDSPKHIQTSEWVAFFEQYGGEGIVGGTIENAKDFSYNSLSMHRTATYYFSNPTEAAFARMAF